MAILTLAEAKAFLKITDTDADRDAQITAFIPAVEDDIAAICNTRFRNTSVSFSGDITITGVSTTYTLTCSDGGISDVAFAVGDYIDLEDSDRNDGYYTIATLADTAVTMTEALITEDEKVLVFYLIQWPEAVRMIAARMIAYQLDMIGSAGISSEHILDYSYTRGEGTDLGYPVPIIKALQRFGHMHCGFGVKRSQYIDKRGTFEGSEIE
jgi:hypothetical protein